MESQQTKADRFKELFTSYFSNLQGLKPISMAMPAFYQLRNRYIAVFWLITPIPGMRDARIEYWEGWEDPKKRTDDGPDIINSIRNKQTCMAVFDVRTEERLESTLCAILTLLKSA